MLTLALAVGFSGVASSQAQIIYDADFSGSSPNFSHTTGNAPSAGTQLSGSNWTIEAVDEPQTDTTANTFGVFGNGSLEASDYGGEGLFLSNNIDVSSWVEVALDFDGTGDFSTNSEFFQWEYSLDAGAPVVLGNVVGDTSGTATLDQSIANLDVTGNSTLVVGFRFDHNGSSDFIDVTNVQVNGVSPVPEPETFGALAGLLALGLAVTRRRRRS